MSAAVSAAVAAQYARTRFVAAFGQRIPGEGRILVDYTASSRRHPLRNPELLQHGRQDAADNGQAAEDREVGVFGHRRAADWEDAL